MASLSRSFPSNLDDFDIHAAPTLREFRAAPVVAPEALEPTFSRSRSSTLLPPPPGPEDLEREYSAIVALDDLTSPRADDEDPYLKRLAEEHAMLLNADKRDTERCPPSFIDENEVEYTCFTRSTSPPPALPSPDFEG